MDLLHPALVHSGPRHQTVPGPVQKPTKVRVTRTEPEQNTVKVMRTGFDCTSADVPSRYDVPSFQREETSSARFACSEGSLAIALGPIKYVRVISRLPGHFRPSSLQARTRAWTARRTPGERMRDGRRFSSLASAGIRFAWLDGGWGRRTGAEMEGGGLGYKAAYLNHANTHHASIMEHLPRSSPSMSEDASAVDCPPDHSPDRSLDRSPFASLSITFSLRFTHHGASRPQVRTGSSEPARRRTHPAVPHIPDVALAA
ncbi:hypothetical protein AcV7_002745 [Taiwanofungus camphoratus]|nr:hypothetical protein AcV7_002745 [Antrodia cinnamomea]